MASIPLLAFYCYIVIDNSGRVDGPLFLIRHRKQEMIYSELAISGCQFPIWCQVIEC